MLASRGEEETAGVVRRYFSGKPYLFHSNVTLSQVVHAERSELTAGEWDYYRAASLDFVITNDDETYSPEIAIEFDGAHHDRAWQKRKDGLKNQICRDAGLPLIRIRSQETLIREGLTFLEYMLDLYFGERQMDELRLSGQVGDEDEFFVLCPFPGSEHVLERLKADHGILQVGDLLLMSLMSAESAETALWLRTSETREAAVATTRVELVSGIADPRTLLSEECSASVTPNLADHGIHGWHLSLELSRYLCLQSLERSLKRRQSGSAN